MRCRYRSAVVEGRIAPRLPLRPPSLSLRALENLALVEAWAALPSLPLLTWAPQGDGHPVLVLPGFTSSDNGTWYLRNVLRAKGYSAHRWGLGVNVGPHPRIVRGVQRRLLALSDQHGRAVSLVGCSLGGVYARELARAYPDQIRQVVTLGSPFRMRAPDSSSAQGLYRRLAPRQDPFAGRRDHEHLREPVPVPTTSIYTRTDGVVRWHACIDEIGTTSENIEVRGTHTGLGVNAAALLAVADRLAQPDGAWQPFRPPRLLGHLYPEPASWEPRWATE
jgi:pimeloyl-ACP methyl ester carboxylesterase